MNWNFEKYRNFRKWPFPIYNPIVDRATQNLQFLASDGHTSISTSHEDQKMIAIRSTYARPSLNYRTVMLILLWDLSSFIDSTGVYKMLNWSSTVGNYSPHRSSWVAHERLTSGSWAAQYWLKIFTKFISEQLFNSRMEVESESRRLFNGSRVGVETICTEWNEWYFWILKTLLVSRDVPIMNTRPHDRW